MKTFVSFKTLFVTLAMAFAFVASAEIRENTLELTQVRAIDAETSELSFNRSFVNEDGRVVKQTLKAIDDDGLLSIAAINFSMMQASSEKVFIKAQESYSAGRVEWDRIKKMGIARFPSVKPALLASLAKLAAYSSSEIKKMKAQKIRIENRNFKGLEHLNHEEIKMLYLNLLGSIHKAEIENVKALDAYDNISFVTDANGNKVVRESITPKEFSDIIGKLLNEQGINHTYATSVNGAPAIHLALLESNLSNPLGSFFASRPLYVGDDVLKMDDSRGVIDLAANVLQEIQTSNRVVAQERAHLREAALEDEFIDLNKVTE